MIKRLLIICCVLFVSLGIDAQLYHTKTLGVEDGLSNFCVRDIVQDKRSDMWFATEDGLNRFDSNRFFVYRKEQGLSANELNCIVNDPRDSVLWVGTQREGLCRLDYTTGEVTVFRHTDSPDSLSENSVTDLCAAADGGIWIATYWGGVNKYDPETGKFHHYNQYSVPKLPSRQIWSVMEGSDGKLYVGHVYHGLSVIDFKTNTVDNYWYDASNTQGLPSGEVFCIFEDNRKQIWLGTSRGLVLFDAELRIFYRYRDASPYLNGCIWSVRQIDDNHLWVATDKSRVCIIDLQQDVRNSQSVAVETLWMGDENNVRYNNVVGCIFQDNHKNVWVGKHTGGLVFISNRKPLFSLYKKNFDLQDRHVSICGIVGCMAVDFNEKLWNGMPEREVLSAHFTDDGSLWVGIKDDGLYCIDRDRNKTKILDDAEVRVLHETTDNRLWVGTEKGFYRINMSSRAIEMRQLQSAKLVWAMCEAQDGTLWVGTFGGGLLHFDENLNMISLTKKKNGLPSNTVNHILQTRDGSVWVATGDGLVVYKSSPHRIIYGRNKGMHNTYIQALAEDPLGNVWFSTNQGIGCYDVAKDTVYNYHDMAGIPSCNFTAGCVAQTPDGAIWFASALGLCSFNPERVMLTSLHPQVHITELTVPQPIGEENVTKETFYHPESRLVFPHTRNTFDIFFAVDDYALSDQVEYAYRIVGCSYSWYSNGSDRKVSLNNLSPGDYTFEVRARMQGGEWGKGVTSLPLTIKPSPWLTPWMKMLYVGIVVVLIMVFVLFHRNKKRLEREVRKRAREIRRLNRIAENFKEEATTFREQSSMFQEEVRTFRKTKHDILTQGMSEQDAEFLMRLKEITERALASGSFDVAWLANEVGMSESTLYRKVKAMTGGSTNDFVRKVKIQYAERLIISGKHTISEIGYMMGYSTPANFRRAFKDEFGLSPSAYLNALKKEDE